MYGGGGGGALFSRVHVPAYPHRPFVHMIVAPVTEAS